MMPAQVYEVLRTLASPVVAVTSAWDGRTNGMILDSAGRASLSPLRPRIHVIIHKWHLSHRLVLARGAFTAHLLRPDQLELVHRLGFRSGNDVPDKLAGLAWTPGVTGTPVLADHQAALECTVLDVLDLGPSHLVVGEAVAVHPGTGGEVLTAARFRASMPPAWREEFERELAAAQERSTQLSDAAGPRRYHPADWR